MNLRPVLIDTMKTFRKGMLWFYGIYTAILLVMSLIFIKGSTSSGTEMSTVVFLLVMGLTIFRPSFVLYCSTGISRKTMLTGMFITFSAVCLTASVLDMALNRFFNLFHPNASNYETLFGYLRQYGGFSSEVMGRGYTPPMDVGSLIAATLWQAAVYFGVLSVAFLIATLFYRLGKVGRTVLCLSPVVPFIVYLTTRTALMEFWIWLLKSMRNLLYGSALSSALSFVVIGLAAFVLCWPVMRKLGVKRA